MKIWNRKGIVCVLLLGWAILVLWNYFRRFPFINLQEVLLNGVMLCLLLLFFTALGTRILRYFKVSFSSFAEELSFSFGIGSGCIIFFMIVLCALRIVHEIVVIGIVLLLFGFVYQDAKTLCLRGYTLLRSLSSKRWSPIDMVLLFLMGLAGITTFLAAATPPFFYDALVYHLAVPQQYLLAHGFHYMPYHHFSNFPMNLGMLFMVGMSFSGGMLAKLISWSFAPMTAIAVYGFAKSRWGIHSAITSAAILFLVPGVLILSTLTSVDLGVMFYSFLSFSALLSWFTSRQKSWFILAGIFCGLAVGTKYTAFVMTFGAILIILFIHEYFSAKKWRFLKSIRFLILFGAIVLCMALPWFIKNVTYTGNPLYPLFNSLLGTHISDQYTYYDQKISATNPAYNLVSTLLSKHAFQPQKILNVIVHALKAPWTFSMKTTRAAGKTGILFLLCIPLIFLIPQKDSFLPYLLALGGCSFWLWVILLPHTALRYAFQMFPPLSLTTSSILWSLPIAHHKKPWLVSGVCLLLCYHLLFFFQDMNYLQPYSYLFTNLSREQFLLEHGVDYYPVMQFINGNTSEDSKILYVGEIRSYYCERDILLATDAYRVDEAILLRQFILESQNAQEVLQKLYQSEITHVIVNFSEMQRFADGVLNREAYFDFQTDKDQEIFDTLVSQYFQLLTSEHQVDVYQVLYPEGLELDQ